MNKYLALYGIVVGVLTVILAIVTALIYLCNHLGHVDGYDLFLSSFVGILVAGLVIVILVYIEESWGR